jgi:hypothetical protein
LKSWAGDLPISKAGFFFWTSGSKEQRSQAGLLRSLLHQLLSDNKAMMPKTFPDLWQKMQILTTRERIGLSLEWDSSELMRAFRSFVDAAVESSKICLFIDGLDEFDGNHLVLVQFFQSLGKGPHGGRVKMCLSSRPWAVFERSFQPSVPNLKLEELTYQDMYGYVSDTLSADSKIGGCLKENSEFKDTLFDETVQRADGVFLWTRLTVSKLLKDFQPSLGFHDLQAIVEEQPTELEDLFEKLLFFEQDAVEKSETANMFRLITARETAASFINDETANFLNVWEIALALDSDDDSLAISDNERQATRRFRAGVRIHALESKTGSGAFLVFSLNAKEQTSELLASRLKMKRIHPAPLAEWLDTKSLTSTEPYVTGSWTVVGCESSSSANLRVLLILTFGS